MCQFTGICVGVFGCMSICLFTCLYLIRHVCHYFCICLSVCMYVCQFVCLYVVFYFRRHPHPVPVAEDDWEDRQEQSDGDPVAVVLKQSSGALEDVLQ